MVETKIEAGPEPVEAVEVEAVEEIGRTEVKEVKVNPVVLVTLMGPQIVPARSIGNSGRGRGYVRTDITVHGETTRAPAQDIIETWLQLK